MTPYDSIIIGAGISGSAAAIDLARAGKKVLLLEKENQAHHKVCGEFISWEAKYYLTNLGLNLENLGAKPIKFIRLIHKNKSTKSPLPFPAFSLSRFTLDENLIQLAIQNGVEVKRGADVRELFFSDEVWNVKYLEGNSTENLQANSIFLATGKHNLKGWPRATTATQNNMIGFKMHFKLSAEQEKTLFQHVEIILFNGGYAGLEPIENGLVNLCLVVTKSCFINCQKDWQTLLNHISTSCPHFAKTMQGAAPSWKQPLAISQIPYGFIHQTIPNEPKNLYRLGDQLAVIPSFSGDGISIALHTAHQAVKNYLQKDSKSYYQELHNPNLPINLLAIKSENNSPDLQDLPKAVTDNSKSNSA